MKTTYDVNKTSTTDIIKSKNTICAKRNLYLAINSIANVELNVYNKP